jgi:hypothetical protein
MFNVGDSVEIWNDGRLLDEGVIVDIQKGWQFPFQVRRKNPCLEDFYCAEELRVVGAEENYQ